VRLRILRDGTFVRSQTLDQEVTKIGRQPSAHVRLDDDSVSRMHTVIECTADETCVIDLGSSMGTLVNGQKVNKKTLRAGDVIDIGPFRLEIESTADDARAN
jgi:pSer/pThr/pTyr-binding forkhead associated (FHA) protein